MLSQFGRELGALDGVAKDLDNASAALREKNQEQVKEMLQRGAEKLDRISEAWRELTGGLAEEDASGDRTAASEAKAEPFTPIAVPAQEPTAPGERERLEARIRAQLRLLRQPYERLAGSTVDMTEVEALLRSCREAVNAGELRKAALSLNGAAERMERLLAKDGGTGPARP